MSQQKFQDSSPSNKIRNQLIKINKFSKHLPQDFFPKNLSQSPQKKISASFEKHQDKNVDMIKAINEFLDQKKHSPPHQFRRRHIINQNKDRCTQNSIVNLHKNLPEIDLTRKQSPRESNKQKKIEVSNELNPQYTSRALEGNKNVENYRELLKNKLKFQLNLGEDEEKRQKLEEKEQMYKYVLRNNSKKIKIISCEKALRARRHSEQNKASTIDLKNKVQDGMNQHVKPLSSNRVIREIRISTKELPIRLSKSNSKQRRLDKMKVIEKSRYKEQEMKINVGFDGMLTFCGEIKTALPNLRRSIPFK